MRPLQVGDRVVIVKAARPENQHLVGQETVVKSLGVRFKERETQNWRNDGVRTTEHDLDVVGKCWRPEHLRRIPPKDDPKSDFLPADDDFTRDLLKQLGRVTA